MNLNDVLASIQKTFKPRRRVDFEDMGLHIDIEPLTSIEELKVMEIVRSLEGSEYMESLKRNSLAYAIKSINEINLDGDVIKYEENGKTVTKSKFLYMQEYLGQFPSSILDNLFGIYSNVIQEAESIITKKMKFDLFEPTPDTEESKKEESSKPSGELRQIFEKNDAGEEEAVPVEPVEVSVPKTETSSETGATA